MALAEQADLVARLRLKDEFSGPAKKAEQQVAALDRRYQLLNQGVGKVGRGLRVGLTNSLKIGATAAGALATQVYAGIQSLAELDAVQKQTEAVIRSTGGAARVTAEAVRDLATKYEDLTTVDDKVVQRGENVLLTFRNIHKNAFEPALAASLDLSVALGKDLTSSSMMVGKALNDPVAGMTALGRAGVQFTDQQKAQIKTLAQSGRTMAAQKIILRELSKEFGGSAAASADTFQGAMNRMGDAIETVQQALAEPLMKPLEEAALRFRDFATSPEVIDGIRRLGEGIAGLFSARNLDDGFAMLQNGFKFLQDMPWAQIRRGLQQTVDIAGQAVGIFQSLPSGLQSALITLLAANKLTGGLVASGLKDIASFALGSLKTINAGAVTVNAGGVAGGAGGGGGGAGGFRGKLGGLAGAIPIIGATTFMVAEAYIQVKDQISQAQQDLYGKETDALKRSPSQMIRDVLGFVRSPDFANRGLDKSISKTLDTQLTRIFTANNRGQLSQTDRILAAQMVRELIAKGYTGAQPGSTEIPGMPGRKVEGVTVGNQGFLKTLLKLLENPPNVSKPRPGNNIPDFPNALSKPFQLLGHRLVAEGKLQAGVFRGIQRDVNMGVINGKQALKYFKLIEEHTKEPPSYQFTLKPSVTISASATGKAITFAANGQRLEIL